MPTLGVDFKNLPHELGLTVEKDTWIRFSHSRPSPRKILGAEAQALHFEYSYVIRDETGTGISYQLVVKKFTAAGPVFVKDYSVYRTVNALPADMWASVISDLDKIKIRRTDHDIEAEIRGPVHSFAGFIDEYEQAVGTVTLTSPSSATDAKFLRTALLATDSPFFYPLNDTNVKHLNNVDKAAGHAKYLHKETSGLWRAFCETLDSHSDDATMLGPDSDEIYEVGPSSILYETITAMQFPTVFSEVGSGGEYIMSSPRKVFNTFHREVEF